jgi:glycosyltransferase involved in cell wall biosynthesis
MPEFEKERDVATRTLFIDHRMLTPDQDSGSVRAFNMLRILQDLGHKVTFLPDNLAKQSPYTERLQALGIEVLYHPFISSIEAYLKSHGKDYDYVFLSRPHVAGPLIRTVRRRCASARIIYDTVDLSFLREMRAAEVDGSTTRIDAELTKARELRIASLADSTIVVSTCEANILAEIAPDLDVHVVSNIHDTHPCEVPFGERRDLLFIGGFEHLPNVDAVLWFVGKILPLIHERLPGVRLHIVGSKAPDTIFQLDSDLTPVHGYVPDVDPFFRECRLSVAPLRYGAGVKGKVNHSLAWGLPCVATTMAAEGMALQHGVDILVADDTAAFADAVVELYTDEDLWNRVSAAGYDNIDRYFSFAAARTALTGLFSRQESPPLRVSRKQSR